MNRDQIIHNTSKDYDLLHDLLIEGNQVLGYKAKGSPVAPPPGVDKIYEHVNIKLTNLIREHGKDFFIDVCNIWDVHFIVPDKIQGTVKAEKSDRNEC